MNLDAVLDLPARRGLATLASLGVAVLGGALFVLATAPHDLWPLGWIMMLPTLWLIDRAPTPRRASLYAWLAGSVATFGGFHWIAELLVHQGGLPTPLGWLGMALFAGYQGLSWLLAARAIRAMRARGWGMVLAAPLALVTVELLFPVVFPYGLFITQAPVIPIIQIADLAGPLAVTALLAAVGGATWDVLSTRRWRSAAIGGGALAAALIYGFVRIHQVEAARADAPMIKVGLISEGVESRAQGRTRARERLDRLDALRRASAQAEAAGAQLIVWTESGFPFNLSRSQGADIGDKSLYRIRRGFTAPVIVGALTSETSRGPHYNSAILIAPDGTFTARHDKVHRVFGSEYNPLVETFPSLESLMPAGAGHFAAGDAPVLLPVTIGGRDLHLAPMICFEDILPAYGREVASSHPDLLVNVTNDSWFGPVEPLQHLALAVYRSVELRTDMVRAVNLGPSTHVDATGRIVRAGARAHQGPEVLVVEAATLPGGGTVFAALGNLFAWGCAGITLVVWLLLPRLAGRRRGRAVR